MKDVRQAIKTLLSADAAVTAICSTRIFPVRLPQGERQPSLVYFRVSEVDDYVMSGDSGLDNARMQLDAWAQSAEDCNLLSNACYDVLSGFKGIVEYGSNSPRDFIDVNGIFFSVGVESYESEAQLYRFRRDCFVWYQGKQ